MSDANNLKDLLAKGAKLYGAGQSAAAAEVYRQALKAAPGDPTVRLRLALAIWHGENRGEEALDEVRALAATYPQASVHGAEALILNSMGRFGEAAGAARRAVTADPRHTSAWRDLATAAPETQAATLDAELEALLAAPDLTATQRRDLHAARATVLHKAGDEDRAFTQTECANGYAPRRWDVDREAGMIAGLRRAFTADLMASRFAAGPSDRRMVFILGMPRSGTTLLERMLTAHPAIASAGETPIVGNLWTQYRRQAGDAALTGEHLSAMGRAYMQGIAQRSPAKAARVIDKMPANYLYLPLIRLMLPDATVIHMRRHPLDTCLSCYEASFAFGLDYATGQVSLGAAYRMYADLMAHWTGPVGVAVREVRYEALVAEPEAVLRPLLAAIGLDWDPACLTPADGGIIKTASSVTARGRVSTASVGRWHRFADRLQPLIEVLGGLDAVKRMDGR